MADFKHAAGAAFLRHTEVLGDHAADFAAVVAPDAQRLRATMNCPWCERKHAGGAEACIDGVVIVCGGRDFDDEERLFRVLDKLATRARILAIRHGDAKGADRLAGKWARNAGIEEQVRPANWDRDGKGAGPIRNQAMLDEGGVACVVAFPGGVGTADMVRRARAADEKRRADMRSEVRRIARLFGVEMSAAEAETKSREPACGISVWEIGKTV